MGKKIVKENEYYCLVCDLYMPIKNKHIKSEFHNKSHIMYLNDQYYETMKYVRDSIRKKNLK